MTTLIVNSNRLDLIDDYHAQNKSIIIDSDKHELLFNDGTGTYSTKEQSAEDARVGDLADLTTTEKSTIVGAINEVNSGVSDNAGSISSLGETVSGLVGDVGDLSGDVSGLDTRVTTLEQAPAILPSYSYAGTLAGLATADWAADANAPVADYGYKATLNTPHLQGNTTTYNEAGNVYFSPADAVGGKLAPYAELTTANYSPVTVVGSPTIDSSYYASGYATTSFIQSTNVLPFSSLDSWELVICYVNVSNTMRQADNALMSAGVSADKSAYRMAFRFKSGNPYSIEFAIWDSSGVQIGAWDVFGFYWQRAAFDGKTWFKVAFNGSKYLFSYSTDGESWSDCNVASADSTSRVGDCYLCFGSSCKTGEQYYSYSTAGAAGTYLAECKLTSSGSTIWEYTTETEQRYAFNIWASEAVATGSIDYSISLLPKGV